MRGWGRTVDAALLRGALGSTAVKVAAAAANYALLVLLARVLPLREFGDFGVLFSASILVGAALICGQPVLVLRSIPEYAVRGDEARRQGVVRFGGLVIGFASALFLISLAGLHAAGALPAALSGAAVLAGFALLSVLTAAADYTANILRALERPMLALVPRDLLWRGVSMLTIAGLAGAGGLDLAATLLVLSGVLGIVVLWQAVVVSRLTRSGPTPVYAVRQWAGSSAWMALGSLLYGASMTVDTLVVGALLPPEEVAIYFSALRTAAASALIIVGVRIVAAPLLARLHYGGDPAGLRDRLRLFYVLSVVTSVAFAAGAILFAGPLMRLFGAEFVAGATAFQVLVLGFAISNAGGVSSVALEATGHERRNALALLATQVGTMLLVALLAHEGGLVGAATGKAVGLAVEAGLLAALVWSALGRSAPREAAAE